MNRTEKRRNKRREQKLAIRMKEEKPKKASGCEFQRPTVRCRVHTPETRPVHRHLDTTFTVKGETDYEVWAQVCRKLIAALGCSFDPLIIGFILDLVGPLPVPVKRLIAEGIHAGLGCQVTEEEDGSVYVRQVPRYPPCAEQPEVRPSGLVIPRRDTSGLVVPGVPSP